MYLSALDGEVVCGKLGGKPFQNATRPDVNNYCPSGTTACSTATSAENTLCVPPTAKANSCPITDILFIGAASETTYVAQGYTILTIESDPNTLLAYNKDTNSLPPTSIKV